MSDFPGAWLLVTFELTTVAGLRSAVPVVSPIFVLPGPIYTGQYSSRWHGKFLLMPFAEWLVEGSTLPSPPMGSSANNQSGVEASGQRKGTTVSQNTQGKLEYIASLGKILTSTAGNRPSQRHSYQQRQLNGAGRGMPTWVRGPKHQRQVAGDSPAKAAWRAGHPCTSMSFPMSISM